MGIMDRTGSLNKAQSKPNADGTWTDARPALNTPALGSQHCVRVDFDNDGLEDIVTNNPTNFVSVYHNRADTTNHWFKVRLSGIRIASGLPTVNAGAVGAVVRIFTAGTMQTREIIAGSSFGATEDPRAHFGLREATSVDRVEVIWPRAGTLVERTQSFNGPFSVDRIITLRPGTPCRGDFNTDGAVDPDDLADFIGAYFDGSSIAADFNGDNAIGPDDLADFIGAFFSGCE